MLHSSLFTFIRTFAPALQARWSLRLSARTRDFHSLKRDFHSLKRSSTLLGTTTENRHPRSDCANEANHCQGKRWGIFLF